MTKQLALVIEDTAALAEGFTFVMEMAGFEVETITNGKEALAWLSDDSNRVPRIVILDYHMPFVNGHDVLRNLRANARFVDTKVLMATADARTAEILRDEADLVLLKPISFTQLEVLARRFANAEYPTTENP